MKVLKDEMATIKRKRRVTIELDHGECALAIRDNAHYRLGDPHGDVVAAHILENAEQVTWCSVEQRWVA